MNEDLSTETSPKAPNTRRNAAIGVAAGLLAGGAIGLAATVPSITSAASDDPVLTDATTDQVVALQDATDEPSDVAPEPGERLREALQPLVDDGTIDSVQADAVAEYLAENRPDRGDHGRRGHRRARMHAPMVAEVIGIDVETLRDELLAGASITDVAEANGVDRQTVVDALVADAQSHIDMAIEHGLDEERAAERLETMTERIEELVDKTRDVDAGDDGADG
ncbi:MAG: hypothetical protein HKN41_00440 [Ilumatobacter sp.]|nr:hypothetical protein [Ilumatobacter sp.]